MIGCLWYKKQCEWISYIVIKDLNLWQIPAGILLELKRLKSYLQISATNWLKVSFIVFLLRQLSKHTTTHIQLFLQIFLSIFKFFGSFICVSRISICWLFSIMDRAWSCSNFLKYGSWKSIRAVKHSFIKSIK